MAKGKKDQYDYLYKIVVVGDGGVGKTSLLSSFTRNNPTSMYCSHYIAVTVTIGGKVIRAMPAGQAFFVNLSLGITFLDSPQLSVNLNVQIDRTAPVYTLLTLAILHGLSQSLPVVQCEKRLEKVAYVSVAMVAGKDDSLQIFDTDGQERFGCLPKSHYEGVTGALLVYDLTNHRTFENIARWLTEINEHTDSSIAIVLVGNKRDLEHSRAVHQEEAIKCASASKIPFMETSAIDATNVEKAFVTIIKKVHEISSAKHRVNCCSIQ